MAGLFRLAIDLGTSNTVVVVDRGDGTPRPLLFDGSPLLPSAVFADVSGAVFVGRDAERHMMIDAARFEPNPKRHVHDGVVLLGDRELPVADLFAAILRRAGTEAARTGVTGTGETVMTCPVNWGNRRRSVLLDAAARAGLGPVTLVDEPVAAAAYCLRALGGRLAPGRCIVVFDFGGGTLDVTVVEADREARPGLRVLATGGLNDLGGADVDAALANHVGQLIAAADGESWRRLAEPRTAGEFRNRQIFLSEVRAAKEMLSRASKAPIHVPGRDQATHLTRAELDGIAGPLVDRAVDETSRVLQRSGVPTDRLDTIVLVGGSSRMPLVASRLHARFGLAPVVPEQPELPVAFGALLLANGRSAAATPALVGPATGRTSPPAAPVGPGTPNGEGMPVQRPPRPSVVIGPGVSLQGDVAVYGSADLMPEDARDGPEPPPPGGVRHDRRRPNGRVAARLRVLVRLLVLWVLIMVLTPWGRAVFSAGTVKATSLLGVRAVPSVSASAASVAAARFEPAKGPANTIVRLIAANFLPHEQVQLIHQPDGRPGFSFYVDEHGNLSRPHAPADGSFRAGTVITLQLVGKTSKRSARVQYVVTG